MGNWKAAARDDIARLERILGRPLTEDEKANVALTHYQLDPHAQIGEDD